MPFERRWSACALALAWGAGLLAPAASAQNYFNPGTMGPNALPPARCESPWVGDDWLAEVGIGIQFAQAAAPRADEVSTSLGGLGPFDRSLTLPFHVEYRLARRAALMGEGTPFEAWLVSAQTERAWGTRHSFGFSRADIRIGGKFTVWKGSRTLPAVAVRAWTKTTTGKSAEDHRFVNAPGYQFDVVLGHRVEVSPEFALELWVAGGFLAWQQAQYGQNDAPAWSATLSSVWADTAALRLEYQGYWGWQKNDKPHSAGLQLELPVSSPEGLLPAVWWFARASVSFRDPTFVGLNVGVRLGAVAEGGHLWVRWPLHRSFANTPEQPGRRRATPAADGAPLTSSAFADFDVATAVQRLSDTPHPRSPS